MVGGRKGWVMSICGLAEGRDGGGWESRAVAWGDGRIGRYLDVVLLLSVRG